MNRRPAVRETTGVGSLISGPDPVLVSILNVTPDSFSDGGEFFGAEPAVAQAEKMLDEGAQIIDVGGESTRPGSDPVSPEEELRRVIPVVQGIRKVRPEAIISIDTYRASIAESVLDAGARVVNDVTALGGDPTMAGLVAERGCPVILMHMLGEPKSMQKDPRYEDVVREVRDFLAGRAEHAIRRGVREENIVLDPGIGFGKTLRHNLELLNNLDVFVELGFPVLVGASRKSFLGKITGANDARARVFGTVATSVMAYEQGATLFRVHDVQANKEALEVAAAVRRA
ncbi:MAG: Dihydropteroate synthase [uncultured Rubrobacteraceae bacterium]|uniref:Dihydropteroate synthase n=1 Tax=uncultured Rubrobacteraceae bacterium TaxID=349277 RepID=A0A6J4Q548_9ACTN|nr:MAG: Dihydropteroate synthase [uncultured Rubrobacteraceae bacterium]